MCVTRSVFTRKYEKFRHLLVSARQALGLSQQALADRMKRPQSFVAKYELGERRLDLIEFLEIVRTLQIDPHVVIDELKD
jgi:ribosome-binding protein aMBF1 (putative translation factor)